MKKLLIVSAMLIALALSGCAPMGGRSESGRGMDGPGESWPRGSNRAGNRGAGPDTPNSVVAQLQMQLQQTAEALKLTPRQLVLWEGYQDRVGALMSDQMKLQTYMSRQQSAMQQINSKVDIVRNRLAAMEDIQEAASKLYGSLDADQKKIADQMLPQTLPALYSGFGGGGVPSEERSTGRENRSGGRGGMGGGPAGGAGSPGGGMGSGGWGRF